MFFRLENFCKNLKKNVFVIPVITYRLVPFSFILFFGQTELIIQYIRFSECWYVLAHLQKNKNRKCKGSNSETPWRRHKILTCGYNGSMPMLQSACKNISAFALLALEPRQTTISPYDCMMPSISRVASAEQSVNSDTNSGTLSTFSICG